MQRPSRSRVGETGALFWRRRVGELLAVNMILAASLGPAVLKEKDSTVMAIPQTSAVKIFPPLIHVAAIAIGFLIEWAVPDG